MTDYETFNELLRRCMREKINGLKNCKGDWIDYFMWECVTSNLSWNEIIKGFDAVGVESILELEKLYRKEKGQESDYLKQVKCRHKKRLIKAREVFEKASRKKLF